MYNGETIRLLLTKQKKSQKDLALAVTGKGNSSLHNLFKNPTVATIEKVADFFGVSVDSFFIRNPNIKYETEKEQENTYLRKLVQYQETNTSAYNLLNQTNENLLEQFKHRVAELESRLKFIQAHPDMIGELEPLPEFTAVIPVAFVKEKPYALKPSKYAERVHKRLEKMYDKMRQAEVEKLTEK